MSDETCARCGQPAKGYATIDGARYCHEGPDPTCYMSASWETMGGARMMEELRTLAYPAQTEATGDEAPRCATCANKRIVYAHNRAGLGIVPVICPTCSPTAPPVAPDEADGSPIPAYVVIGNERVADLTTWLAEHDQALRESITAEVEARMSAGKAAERERIAVAIEAHLERRVDNLPGTVFIDGMNVAARIARDGGDQS